MSLKVISAKERKMHRKGMSRARDGWEAGNIFNLNRMFRNDLTKRVISVKSYRHNSFDTSFLFKRH